MVSTAHSTAVGAQETDVELVRGELLMAPVPVARSCCAVRVLSRCTLFACWTLVMRKERLRSQEGSKYPLKVSRVEGSGGLFRKKNCHPRPSTQGTLDKVP